MYPPKEPPGLSLNNGYARASPTLSLSMDILQNEYQSIIAGEQRRHEFVETLMSTIQHLTTDKQEALKKLSRAEFTCDSYQSRLESADKEIDELQKAIDCNRFVLVLADGDNTLFLDDYIKDGAKGGDRAARDFRQAIFDHLKDQPYFQHDYSILIRLYANLRGLSQTYVAAKTIPNAKVLQDFVQAFNKSYSLVEIVDAGDDKEAADSKVKACFNLYHRNLHCKHILFSGSGDSSYVGFLRAFVPVDGIAHDITLIEALPFTKYLQPLSLAFQHAEFPKVLRGTKIDIDKIVSQHNHASSFDAAENQLGPASRDVETMVRPTLQQSEERSNSENGNGQTTWANAMKAALPVVSPKLKESTPQVAVTAQPTPTPTGPFIYLNKDGDRVDKPIPSNIYDKDIIDRLKSRKMCNKHWLLGKCEDGDWCAHHHKGPLTSRELENLRHVARMRPCDDGLQCLDPKCFNGHKCQYGMKCKKKDCWFNDGMHQVEPLQVVKVPVVWSEYNWQWAILKT